MTNRTTAPPVEHLIEEAQADPAGYRRRVDELIDHHRGDALASVHVRWASGVALRELGQLPDALSELQQATDQALTLGAMSTAALIRSSRALVLLHLGDASSALIETEEAGAELVGVDAARNAMQRGLILQRLGRHEDAIAAYGSAHPALVAAGDLVAEARLLSNRGVLRAYRGELADAQADLERASELGRHLGGPRPVALCLQNLGFVAGRQGRLSDALALLGEADQLLGELDDVAALAVLDMDRAELLADAGLLDEAIERASAAAERLADDHLNGAEAELLVARLSLLAGHARRARVVAGQLVDRFRDAGRHGWALQARYVALAARAAEPVPGPSVTDGTAPRVEVMSPPDAVDVAEAAELADDLEAGGWATEASAARLFAARRALDDGHRVLASQLLDRVRRTNRSAPALTRAQHWFATALVRIGDGDRAAARRAITAGLEVLDRSRLAFGSAELRAHAAAHTSDLVELAVRLALEDGRPAEALRALDRVRATDLGVRVQPHDDPRIAADLAELRRLTEDERVAARRGHDVQGLVAARAQVERRLRDRTRAVTSDGGEVRAMLLEVAALRRALDGRTLAAYLHLDGRLHLIEVGPHTTRHHELGPLAEVEADVAYLRAAVRRLAHAQGSPASLAAAELSLARSVEDLTRRLGLDRIDRSGLVVVPSAALDGLPWAALADGVGCLPAVSPSAGAWLAATGREHASDTTLLAAGPGLPGARSEVDELATVYPGAVVLRDDGASVAAVLAAMERAETVHLAAHGRFRADNPLLSSLRLADGILTVYELEALTRLPSVVVLSSCDAAAATTVGGDAVLGLSSVLLRLGVASVIAPVVEIPDEATGPLMVDLHRRLAAGDPPRRALDVAIAGAPAEGPAERAVRAAFMVVGR